MTTRCGVHLCNGSGKNVPASFPGTNNPNLTNCTTASVASSGYFSPYPRHRSWRIRPFPGVPSETSDCRRLQGCARACTKPSGTGSQTPCSTAWLRRPCGHRDRVYGVDAVLQGLLGRVQAGARGGREMLVAVLVPVVMWLARRGSRDVVHAPTVAGRSVRHSTGPAPVACSNFPSPERPVEFSGC